MHIFTAMNTMAIITIIVTALASVGAGAFIFKSGMNYAFGIMAKHNTVEELKAFLQQMNQEKQLIDTAKDKGKDNPEQEEPTPFSEL